MENDFNSKAMCKLLLKYGAQMREKNLEAEVSEGWEDIPKILNEISLAICGDGNPTHQMQNNNKHQIKIAFKFVPMMYSI